MNWKVRLMNGFCGWSFAWFAASMSMNSKRCPSNGPLIIVVNHINFLEARFSFPHVIIHPGRKCQAGELNKPAVQVPLRSLGVIPINRRRNRPRGFPQNADALTQRRILVIFPEGTRSRTGEMLPGKPGVVTLVMKSGASILPVGLYGYENFWENLKRLRKTDFHISIGKPFHIDMNGDAPSRDVRQVVTDEIMYKIAELLPERYRGHYYSHEEIHYRYVVPSPAS